MESKLRRKILTLYQAGDITSERKAISSAGRMQYFDFPISVGYN